MAARLKVTQVKSGVGNSQRQRDTLRTLGLKRIGDMVVKDDTHVASAYDITFGSGDDLKTVSGIEIFRVANGKITETWNSAIQPGAWG